FANDSGAVALLLEQGPYCKTALWNECSAISPEYADRQAASPGVSTRHNRIAGGCTDRGGGMGVRKPHPLPGQVVDVGCVDPAVGIVDAYIAVTQIVSKNVHNIGLGWLC